MNPFKKFRSALAVLATAAAATARRIVSSQVTEVATTAPVEASLRDLFNRSPKLSGLEIRAVRMKSRCVGSGRTGRSRYVPDGIPARVTKAQKRAELATPRLAVA